VPGMQFHLVPKKTFNTEKLVCRDNEGEDKESTISVESDDDEQEEEDIYRKNK